MDGVGLGLINQSSIINELQFQEFFFFSYVMMVNYGACALFGLLSRCVLSVDLQAQRVSVLIENRVDAVLWREHCSGWSYIRYVCPSRAVHVTGNQADVGLAHQPPLINQPPSPPISAGD